MAEAAEMTSDSRSRRWLLVVYALLALAGIGVSIYLTSLHLHVHTDPAYRSFCAISREVNCDTVAESAYSVFAELPVSVWGIFGYAVMGALALAGLVRRRPSPSWPAGLLVVLSSGSFAVALGLAAISKLIIQSICLMCMAAWAINTAMLVLAIVLVRLGGGAATTLRADLRALAQRRKLVVIAAVAALVVVARVWYGYHPGGRAPYWAQYSLKGPGGINHGSIEGYPYIGGANAKLSIDEFSDYQCSHCRRAHQELRKLVEEHPNEIRIFHRHYPLDHQCNPIITQPFHLQGCQRSAIAACAEEQGKFWEMNDALFRSQGKEELDLKGLSARLGLDEARLRSCLSENRAKKVIDADIADGNRLGIRGTPTFVINDEKFEGAPPIAEILKRIGK